MSYLMWHREKAGAMRMSRLVSRLGCRWLPIRDHQDEVWSAAPPHLTHMGTKHGEALDRTPMWALDELCARMGEAGLIYAYARVHGHCPPGQFWSCI